MLAKIVQQGNTATTQGLGKLLHTLQFGQLHFFCLRFFYKLAQLYNIGKTVKQQGACRQTVATATTNFLIVTLYVFGHIVMDYPTYIAFINAHPKGNGGHDYRCAVIDKVFLYLITGFSIHSGMVCLCFESVVV